MDKEKEFNKITKAEEKLTYLYREIFILSDKIDQIYEYQKDLGQMLINLLKEQKPPKRLS